MLVRRLSSSASSVTDLLRALEGIRAWAGPAQLFDAKAIVCRNQLLLAEKLAETAFKERKNISTRMENEILLWAAGTTKMDKAIKGAGVKDPSDFILFIPKKVSKKMEGKILGRLKAKALPARFKKEREDFVLEKIALSRII